MVEEPLRPVCVSVPLGVWTAPLHLVAQPIVVLASGALVGVEVLTRVSVATGPAPRPDHYWATAAAVDPQMATVLDRWVWQEAQRYMRGAGRTFLNTTVVSLAGEDPVWLGLVLSDTACEVGHPQAVDDRGWAHLATYQAAGGWVVWDASDPADLTRTLHLPNVVKIPRRWSHGVSDNAEAARMVHDWILAIHNAGAIAVALGVEHVQDARWFEAHGADWGQGYYWGAPAGFGGLR